jgi:hypothetical protein
LSSDLNYSVRLADGAAPTLSTQGYHSRKLPRWCCVHGRYNQTYGFLFSSLFNHASESYHQVIGSSDILKNIRLYLIGLYTAPDRLCGLVVRVLGYRSRGPGSIPGTTRFSGKKKENISGSGTGSTQPREYN